MSRIIVLHGEISRDAAPDEQDTLVQVRAVCEALRALNHSVETFSVSLDLSTLIECMRTRAPDLVFNLVETLGGSMSFTSWVPAILEQQGIPCSGCSSRALSDTTDKCLAKQLLAGSGISTPGWWDPRFPSLDSLSLPTRVIIKSVHEEGSIGLTDKSVALFSEVEAIATEVQIATEKYAGHWFAEEFMDGREFNISLLERTDGMPQVLPIAEIDFGALPADRPKIVGYAAKWDEESVEFKNTTPKFASAEGDSETLKILESVALRCWQAFALSGYARVDIRLSSAGVPHVLEVNANPCIAPGAGFCKAAAEAGLSYVEMIQAIISSAKL